MSDTNREQDARLRPALPDDAAAITRLHVAGWQVAYRGLLPDELLDSLDVEERTRTRRQHLESPFSPELRNWVLEDAAGLVGWAATAPARDEDLDQQSCELLAIYLDPPRYGQGHGRRLLAHCLEDTTARGYREMVLWVLVGNERASRFYSAAGFERDETVPAKPFRDTGVAECRLRRALG